MVSSLGAGDDTDAIDDLRSSKMNGKGKKVK